MWDVQSENFGCVSRLYAVAFALSRVACDDSEIGPCDGEDSAAILSVRVELSLLGMGERTVWHDVRCMREIVYG